MIEWGTDLMWQGNSGIDLKVLNRHINNLYRTSWELSLSKTWKCKQVMSIYVMVVVEWLLSLCYTKMNYKWGLTMQLIIITYYRTEYLRSWLLLVIIGHG
jgi:hypothetical protein